MQAQRHKAKPGAPGTVTPSEREQRAADASFDLADSVSVVANSLLGLGLPHEELHRRYLAALSVLDPEETDESRSSS